LVKAVLLAETPESDAISGDATRLDGDSGETSLALVLLTVDIVVVTNLNSLQVLSRPGGVEVGEHHVDHLLLLHACGDVGEPELQDPEIVFLDSALNLHLSRAIVC
jgi:hypothetical protein